MKNCLLTAPLTGAFWLIFLFVLCFLGVHLVRLAKIGWKYQKNRSGTPSPPQTSEQKRDASPSRAGANEQSSPPDEKKDEPAKGPPEPVYYIVERKRKRTRDSYSPPKEIKFK